MVLKEECGYISTITLPLQTTCYVRLCVAFPFFGQVLFLSELYMSGKVLFRLHESKCLTFLEDNVCSMRNSPPLSLKVFPHPLQYRPLYLEGRSLIKISHLGLSRPESSILCIWSGCGFLF